jgi:uncharacterized protein
MAKGSVVHQTECLLSLELPFSQTAALWRHRYQPQTNPGPESLTIVTGLHGDELDGAYVCALLHQFLQDLPKGWRLKGTINLLPNVNPWGTVLGERLFPLSNCDLNRNFPGNAQGVLEEKITAAVIYECLTADVCLDIHSSNSFLKEVPQIRVVEERTALEDAKSMGLDLVWTHSAQNWIAGSLAKSLYEKQKQVLVLETGTGRRIVRRWAERIYEGVLRLCVALNILHTDRPLPPRRRAVVVSETGVDHISAPQGGLFIPAEGIDVGQQVYARQILGHIIHPVTLSSLEVTTPSEGYLFTLRVNPSVLEGALLGRIARGRM